MFIFYYFFEKLKLLKIFTLHAPSLGVSTNCNVLKINCTIPLYCILYQEILKFEFKKEYFGKESHNLQTPLFVCIIVFDEKVYFDTENPVVNDFFVKQLASLDE